MTKLNYKWFLDNLGLVQYIVVSSIKKNISIMSDDHKMTAKDKLVLGITLAAIFGGVFALGLVGLIVNLSN